MTKELQRLFMSTVRGEAADPHGWLTHVRAERAGADAERRGVDKRLRRRRA